MGTSFTADARAMSLKDAVYRSLEKMDSEDQD
jgi:hypothetical protein